MNTTLETESEDYKRGWEDRKQFDIKLLKSMASYWIDRIIRKIESL